ncbi:MAG: protein tyrosine phosphatase family protein [Pseudomonadota bacterium]
MEHIKNFVQLTDRFATAGQPAPADFAAIAEHGHVAVVNLAMPDSTNAIPDEGARVSETGMTYVHIPVPFDAPTDTHQAHLDAVLDALSPAPVFVHCALNYRVSAFMYRHLTARGAPAEAARSRILDAWEPEMDDVWRRFLGWFR